MLIFTYSYYFILKALQYIKLFQYNLSDLLILFFSIGKLRLFVKQKNIFK